MSKFGTIRMKDLQTVIASVSDSIHSDLGLKIKNIPARYDCDLAVRELGQHLQSFLGLRRDDGQGRLLGQGRNCPVKVEDDSQLGTVVHKFPKILLEVFNIQFVNVLLGVMAVILN